MQSITPNTLILPFMPNFKILSYPIIDPHVVCHYGNKSEKIRVDNVYNPIIFISRKNLNKGHTCVSMKNIK